MHGAPKPVTESTAEDLGVDKQVARLIGLRGDVPADVTPVLGGVVQSQTTVLGWPARRISNLPTVAAAAY